MQSAVVEERGLALWAGVATDFGVGVTLSSDRWTVRGITSMTVLPVGIHDRPTFQQVDAIRPLFLSRRVSIAGGGGVRALWDGTSVLVGRLLANSDAGGGRLQGSVVTEHAISSLDVHDAADLLTTVGWSRPVGARLSVGIEGIGQDLEGLWDPAERDGGATLMVGPSLHAQSISGRWTASVTAGPVAHKASTAAPPVRAAVASSAARHFGVFASATWTP